MDTLIWAERPVIVTGAGGFLGSHLLRALAKAKARVLALDKVGPPRNLPDEINWRLVDLTTNQGMAEGLAQGPGSPEETILIHLAALSLPIDNSLKPELGWAINANMTLALGRTWRDLGGQRLFFTSSGLVYARVGHRRNISENDPVFGHDTYSKAKLAAEHDLAALAAENDLALQVVRFSNIYGQGAHLRTVVSEAMEMVKSGQTPVLRRPGEELDFLYIDDAIQGIMRLCSLKMEPGVCITNLSTGKGWRVAQMAAEVSRLAGVASPPDDETQIGYGYRLVLDNTRLRLLTGWEPKIGLAEGLEKTWRMIQSLAF